MRRILEKMNFEIESCENRLEEEKDEIVRIKLKERMKTIKEFRHHLESEIDDQKELGDSLQVLKYSPFLQNK